MGFKAGAIAWLVIFVVLLPGTVRAEGDVVILDTGMVLEGKILSRNEKALRMLVDGLGKMEVPLASVRSINGKAPHEEKPAPAPAEPDPAGAPETPAAPTPAASPTDVPYEDLKTGRTLLFVLAGEDHGDWLETGRRVVAQLGTVGTRRFKIVTDPEGGVLGERWVKREDLLRAIDLEGHDERRLLFLSDGVESGSWVTGATISGEKFEGRLGGITREGSVTLYHAEGDRVVKSAVSVAELRWLQAVTRSKAFEKRIEGLAAGEPVEFTVRGRSEPVAGVLVRSDDDWITVADGTTKTHLFRGLPIIAVRTLPGHVRRGLAGVAPADWVTIDVRTEDDEAVTLRSVTGRYQAASLSRISLMTADGEESFTVASIQSVSVPEAERIPALTARKESSSAETILPVLPGMTRAEVEKRTPVGVEGLDLLWDGDRVSTVYVRPPYPGPVFGIRLDDSLEKALTKTDLVFDTEVTPKESDGILTMVSRTLTTREVRLLVAKSGAILAAEVSAR